eukprot:116956_1
MTYTSTMMYAVATAIITAFLTLVSYNIYNRFQSALPNEWLLVIKDGVLKTHGIGISVFRGIGETVVRFPSLLNKVTFSAQQVSKEMQGVELNGFIIWVVHREDTGPLKAFKHIKDLSHLRQDSEVNQHIKSMAESIVRSQIANLSINEVISQRKKVRERITGEMQVILSGWGIWLETVEITEVKILSNSLFNDLQQPFRSSTRQMAEKIRIDTDHDLQEKRVLTDFKLNKLRNEKNTETHIEKSKMRLTQEKAEQKVLLQREEIKRQAIEMKNQTQILECKMNMEIQSEKHTAELKKIEHSLKMKQLQHGFELKKIQDKYDVDAKMGDVNMKKQILTTVENVYKSMNVDSMKIVNFGTNQGLEHGIGKMAMALREVGNQLNGDND